MIWIWLSIAIIFIIMDCANKECNYIWFSLSSLISTLLTLITKNYVLQFFTFIICGFILMVIFRKKLLLKLQKYLDNKYLNKQGIVIKDINKIGKIKIGNRNYKARSNKKIKKGKKVLVIKVTNKEIEVKEIK